MSDCHFTSRSFLTCRISVEEIAIQMNICIYWVPDYRDIQVTETIKEANLRWLNTPGCNQLKLIWASINKKRTMDLLSLQRNNIFEAISVLTGYWLFGKHGNRLGIITSQSCRSCGDTDDGETTEHFEIISATAQLSCPTLL